MARSDDANRRAEYGTRRVLPVWFVAIGCSAGSVPMDDILFVPLLRSIAPRIQGLLNRGLTAQMESLGMGPRKDDRSASLWLLP